MGWVAAIDATPVFELGKSLFNPSESSAALDCGGGAKSQHSLNSHPLELFPGHPIS
jgi:hypothetical protein